MDSGTGYRIKIKARYLSHKVEEKDVRVKTRAGSRSTLQKRYSSLSGLMRRSPSAVITQINARQNLYVESIPPSSTKWSTAECYVQVSKNIKLGSGSSLISSQVVSPRQPVFESRIAEQTRHTLTLAGELSSAVNFVTSIFPSRSPILDLDATVIAEYLTALDLILFREAIQPEQFVLKIYRRRGDDTISRHQADRAARLERRAPMVAHWVLCEILEASNPTQRADYLLFFTIVTETMMRSGDMEGASVIFNALTDEKLSAVHFPMAWHTAAAVAAKAKLTDVQSALGEYSARICSGLADPVIPICTGRTGLLEQLQTEYENDARFLLRPTSGLFMSLSVSQPPATTEPQIGSHFSDSSSDYDDDEDEEDVPPVNRLSPFTTLGQRTWAVHQMAWSRVLVGHSFGTIDRQSYALQIYDPNPVLWKEWKHVKPNQRLTDISRVVETRILFAWQKCMWGGSPGWQQRQFVLDFLHKRAVANDERFL